MQVKLIPSQTYPICPCPFTINGKPYHHLRIPYQPLFQIANEIKLNSSGNKLESVLMVLTEQITYVPIEEARVIIDEANKYLGVKLDIELRDVAAGILSGGDTKQVVEVLDPTLLALALRLVYEQVDGQRAEQLTNTAIGHVESSNKNPQQKKVYKHHIENVKKEGGYRKKQRYIEKRHQIPEIERSRQEEIQKQQVLAAQHARKTQKYYVPPDPKLYQQKEKDKENEDLRIKFGINGNNTLAWRERLRPARYITTQSQII